MTKLLLVGPTLHLTAIALLLISSSAAEAPAPAYANHTVGGPAGWIFDAATNTTAANYSAWALTQTFNLGDYLIFNTNSSQSVVIETSNATTFRSCSGDDASDDDTFIYNGGDAAAGQPMTIEIPLTSEGTSYYFSGTGDGVPCTKGMAFEIQVNHGIGLPPILNQPPPPPYTEGPDSSPSTEGVVPVETPGNGGARSGAAVGWGLVLLFALPLIGGY